MVYLNLDLEENLFSVSENMQFAEFVFNIFIDNLQSLQVHN